MPVVGIPLDELFARLGTRLDPDELVEQLHRFGCSVEGWADVHRFRCGRCGTVSESADADPPPACDGCGRDLRGPDARVSSCGSERVLRMELLAVRPDLFDPAGLARGLAGFLGLARGAPVYTVARDAAPRRIRVDPRLAGPDVVRPRIAAATVHGLRLDESGLRSLMKLQENVHWALGRDRKLASIGVYDAARLAGGDLEYRATPLDAPRFVPLGFDPSDPAAAMTPAEILERHPKGRAFARLLSGARRAPLLVDASGQVLSMPPIINSEATRVTTGTTDVLVDVTGLDDRHVDRALAIVVTSLVESSPGAVIRPIEIAYAGGSRTTPELEPERVSIDPDDASRVLGVDLDATELAARLEAMRHDVEREGSRLTVAVPAWRADVLHARDLYEDAAIAYGYDRFPAAPLTSATAGAPHAMAERARVAREIAVGLGFVEVMTLALSSQTATFDQTGLPREDDEVLLEHPISVEQTMVRISTIPGLLETLAVNLGHAYPQRIAEVGLVTRCDAGAETGAVERLVVGLAMAGDGLGYADVRGVVDALVSDLPRTDVPLEVRPADWPLFLAGRGAELVAANRRVGALGEVSPEVLERYRIVHPVAVAEIDLDALAGTAP